MGKPINPAECLSAAIEILRQRPSALLTDLDGTISPIVSRPQDAVVDSKTVAVLRRLSRALDVVGIVSGRSVSELRSMINAEHLTYIGNHGLEWWEDGHAIIAPEVRTYLPLVAATIRSVREKLDLPGLLFEDKGVTGSIHYRLSPEPRETRDAILSALAECPTARSLRFSPGRKVVDILPPVMAGKGTAVERMVHTHHLRGVLYLGDDSTDLNAFRELRALNASGCCKSLLLAVSSPEAPEELLAEADYRLDGVDSVLTFLELTATRLELDPPGLAHSLLTLKRNPLRFKINRGSPC